MFNQMDGMIDMLDFLIPYTVRAKLWAGKKRYLLLFQEAAIMDKKLAYYQEKAREKAREEWDRFEACTALDFLNTVNFDFPMDGAPSRFERDPSPLGRPRASHRGRDPTEDPNVRLFNAPSVYHPT